MFGFAEPDENDNVNATVVRLYAVHTKYVVAVCVCV